jgi:hypothetical protein
MVYFGAGQAVDLMRIATGARDGSRQVTVVNFGQQRLAEFRVGATWFALVGEADMAGLLAQLFGLLTVGGSTERDVVVCDPDFGTCWSNCADMCHDHGGMCEFHYSCDTRTGAVTCSCRCCQTGGSG